MKRIRLTRGRFVSGNIAPMSAPRRFILTLFLACGTLAGVPTNMSEFFVRVKPGIVLREKPSATSRAITKIPFGHEVVFRKISSNTDELLGLKGHWYEIQNGYSDMRKGWVFGPLLRENADEPTLIIVEGKAVEETVKVPEAIFDSRTKLFWTSCNAEQTYVEGRCRGASFQRYSTEDGEKYCATLKIMGLKWQLPSLVELRTIANENFNKQFPYSELGFYSSSEMRMNSTGTEDYFMRLEIPTRVENGSGMMGEGMIKCYAKT